MKIIKYDPQYTHALVTLWRKSKRHALGDYNEPHDFDDMLHYTSSVMAVEEKIILAVEGDELIGFMSTNDNWLHQLYIGVDYIGKGVGTALLNVAKQESNGHLQLYTFQCNQIAQSFYEKHEFNAVKFGSDNEEGLADILYEWKDS